MRYFIKLSYCGTPFCGWQRQPNAPTVQESLERALSIIYQTEVPITGAGRTDTGVHARQMWAHFDVENKIQDKNKFIKSLQHLSGRNISIIDLIPVKSDAHARFDAISRTYKYFIGFHNNPLMQNRLWYCTSNLDFDKMNEATDILLKTEDFTSFSKLHSDTKTNICHVFEAKWSKIDGLLWNDCDTWVFTISADRFLRNMVRAIVGTLIDVGRGRISVNNFYDIIVKKNRCAAGPSMAAEGLYLWQVKYPDNIYI